MLRVREKTAVYNAKREASGETNPIDTKILNIWPSELSVDQAIQYFFFLWQTWLMQPGSPKLIKFLETTELVCSDEIVEASYTQFN